MSSTTCAFDTFQAEGDVAIDATDETRLNSFRERCRVLLPGRVQEHASREGAVAYCKSRRGPVDLIGHGRAGLVGTGCGDPPYAPPEGSFINAAHLGDWSGRTLTSLRVIACNAGAGEAGLTLVQGLARASGVRVSAPTGFVWIGAGCADMYLEPGTVWITDAATAAVPEPSFDRGGWEFGTDPVLFASLTGFVAIPSRQLRSVRLRSRDTGSTELWVGAAVRDALEAVQFEAPLLRGSPLAFETGEIEVTYTTANGPERRAFGVFNDRFIRDRVFGDVYYRADVARLRVS
ncbi:MAG: hypothetical protein AB7P99_05370 [Vicinamibacterales bacterium]